MTSPVVVVVAVFAVGFACGAVVGALCCLVLPVVRRPSSTGPTEPTEPHEPPAPKPQLDAPSLPSACPVCGCTSVSASLPASDWTRGAVSFACGYAVGDRVGMGAECCATP